MWEYMRPDELYHNQYQKGLHWKWKKKRVSQNSSITINDLYQTGKYAVKRKFNPSLENELGYQYNINKMKVKSAYDNYRNNKRTHKYVDNQYNKELAANTKKNSSSNRGVKNLAVDSIIKRARGASVTAKAISDFSSKKNRQRMAYRAFVDGARKKRIRKRDKRIHV